MTNQDKFFATVMDEAFALLVLENYMGCMGKYQQYEDGGVLVILRVHSSSMTTRAWMDENDFMSYA